MSPGFFPAVFLCCFLCFTAGENDVFYTGTTTGIWKYISKINECQSARKVCSPAEVKTDIEIADCILSYDISNDPKDVSVDLKLIDDCRMKVGEYISNLRYGEVLKLFEPVCHDELRMISCVSPFNEILTAAQYFKCFMDNLTSIKNVNCTSIVNRLSVLPFFQPMAMKPYFEDCVSDKIKFNCNSHAGSEVLLCLQNHILELNQKCQVQILRLSEIQGENIKYDRRLFEACKDERQHFCKTFLKIAPGKMYECLLKHRNEMDMSSQCRNELLRHEQLIAQDYLVSKGLVKACREDIRNNHCRKSVSDDKNIRLAQILLCLENATHYDSNLVKSKCKEEMLAHRRMLLEDYRLSPELVNQCSRVISKYCSPTEFGGKTIHCLMDQAKVRRKNKISPNCLAEIEILIKETDVGEDWKADPIIWKSCQSVASVACNSFIRDDARTMNCLIDKLGTSLMTEECELSLRQVQYFLARDYKLDPMLFKACNEQASELCGANPIWAHNSNRNRNFVLPCLFVNSDKLTPMCSNEVRRVMRQRALNVDLHPNVELACIDDLAKFCSEKSAKGEEILCLQDNLEKLKPECTVSIYNFTELQSQFIELNPIITTNCQDVANEICQDKGQELLECLIEKKNDPLMKLHLKCRAAVEHQQLISLKDYHFTYKFKKACKFHVNRFCPGPKDKAEVVKCLSEKIRNDTLMGSKQHISKECHQQLRSQLLQQRENVDLNPKLKADCNNDIKTICGQVTHGNAKVLECLMAKKVHLSESCKRRIFLIERQELTDSYSDYTLIHTCKTMLDKFCRNLTSSDQPLNCLKKYKFFEEFDYNCRAIVVQRMIEQSTDYRFDLDLQTSCRKDITEYCTSALTHHTDRDTTKTMVMKCLKTQFRMGRLSKQCEAQVVNSLREAALNYKLNPLLSTVCYSEIQTLCQNENDNSKIDRGEVEECLKQALYNGQISDFVCKQEIIELLNEGKADIQTDPLLYKACLKDLQTHCQSVEKGAGRQLECLIHILHGEDLNQKLHWSCEKMLKERVEMYKIKLPRRMENLGELYGQVSTSPSRKYFMVIALTFIGMTFISGMFCGRILRRSRAVKNK
ncbi:Golgi apparatus protein 1 [Cimex lectularius]|uniref:Golgi apparatus protein 1 n=1 Tax=Cimex lectularius TaxID=79782 RepID=A0A8I6RUU2_CIMLE|nr:Golgi apparatus protein 1 [Cimex lectularius]